MGFGLVGLGAASAAVGGWALVSASSSREDALDASQADAEKTNDEIRTKNVVGGVALGVSVAALGTGVALLFWPESKAPLRASVTLGGARLDGAF
jgi:hypothetical protein